MAPAEPEIAPASAPLPGPEPGTPAGRGAGVLGTAAGRAGLALRALAWLGIGLLALVAAALAFLHSPPGRQFVAAQINALAPASGLRFEVGRIEGSVLWSATFHDVRLRDADGALFLAVPAVDLGWRPYKFLFGSLHIRHLVLRGGTLHAPPRLRPGDPEAPILPGFAIRVDRLAIDGLEALPAMLGEGRRIDFAASLDVGDGQVRADARGEFGGEFGGDHGGKPGAGPEAGSALPAAGPDAFSLQVEARPDHDQFDIDLDWRAPAGGFLSRLTGIEEELLVFIAGQGNWQSWKGRLDARLAGAPVLDFALSNAGGRYRALGRARPGALVDGMLARSLGDLVLVDASASMENRIVEAGFVLRGRGVNADGAGRVNLAENRFEKFAIAAQLLDPALLSPQILFHEARLAAILDGPFADFSARHLLEIGRIEAGATRVFAARQQGTLSYRRARLAVPIDVAVGRIETGAELIDPRLVNGRARGMLSHAGQILAIPELALRFAGAGGRLSLRTDLASGRTRISGPIEIAGLALDGIGTVDGGARIRLGFGGPAPWSLRAQADGRLGLAPAGAAADLIGPDMRFAASLATGQGQPILIEHLALASDQLEAELEGMTQIVAGGAATRLAGSGDHDRYGAFSFGIEIDEEGPRATLALASPLPAAGLADVRLALRPAAQGYAIEGAGQSSLGPFAGVVNLSLPGPGEARVVINQLDIASTRITGALRLAAGGIAGQLAARGGGVEGTIDLAPRDGRQSMAADVRLRDARFAGAAPIRIARGTIGARASVGGGVEPELGGELTLEGVSRGDLFLGRVAARGRLKDGVGGFDASLRGARESRLDLALNGRVAPGRITLAARGGFGGRALAMPRPAVLSAGADGGWVLERSQISYGDGFLIASGRFGGADPAALRLALARLPLALTSALGADLGLEGAVSGLVDLRAGTGMAGPDRHPAGHARLMVRGLARSGAHLASQPIDLALVAQLAPDKAQARAVLANAAGTPDRVRGRIQALIANLPDRGGLGERLSRGDLRASLRVQGAAAALWRLAALDVIDLTGDLRLAADVRGTMDAPRLTGTFAGDGLRLQSALTGTDLRQTSVRGRFAGLRIELLHLAGTAPNGGRISGSGVLDLAKMGASRGPGIDLRLAARGAQILDLPMMGATITGPLRIVSEGIGGTVAGRLRVERASWRLGAAAEGPAQLPSIAITELNRPADARPVVAEQAPWRFLIDASAPAGLMVDGLGLDSEWRGEIRLRGTTEDPRLGGEAEVVPRQGFYDFAGVRFDLTRGRIRFDETRPVNPQIDIVAQSRVNAINVAVTIAGEAANPQITFASTPALPEEELLAQMLFGGSVANLSATDALQLAAAVASLRGGGELGPINQLRSAIGVDRLRLVAADPALGRGASVAIGKNISRRLYAEVITDGAGYNATDFEFRITGWLSLLGTVNTIGRDSATLIFNRDY